MILFLADWIHNNITFWVDLGLFVLSIEILIQYVYRRIHRPVGLHFQDSLGNLLENRTEKYDE